MGLRDWIFGRKNTSASSSAGVKEWKDWLRTPVLSPSAFTAACAGAMKAAFPELTIQVRQTLEIALMRNGEEVLKAFGGNFFADCPEEFEERVAHVEHFVATMAMHMDEITEGRSACTPEEIVPIIKDARFLDQSDPQVAEGLKKMAFVPLVADLFVFYVQDKPQQLGFIQKEDLHKLGLSLNKELLDLAVSNLRKRLADIEVYGDGPLRMISCGGTFEASLLLESRIWDQLANDLHGDLLAAVPARDLMIVTGSQEPEGLSRLRQMIERVNRSGDLAYAITDTILVRRLGQWHALE
jgi:uncharacterized protein YtpQ (UPF0354 family)